MTDINHGPLTVTNDEDIVVFLIGARINRWWLLPLSLPIISRMQAMLKELQADPDSGFLGVQPLGFGGMVQYWRSIDHLLAYADDRKREHRPAAKKFYRKLLANDAAGIWHETFIVKAGAYEALYTNMPTFGMGQFRPLVPAKERRANARGRLAAPEEEPLEKSA